MESDQCARSAVMRCVIWKLLRIELEHGDTPKVLRVGIEEN